jgi:four helix bundle protein
MGFEYLRVYQAAQLLDTIVIALVARAPRGLAKDCDQLLRAVGSVLLNIAEAYGSEQPGKKINHLEIARGSVNEARAALQRLVRRGALVEKETHRPTALTYAIAKMLTAWIEAVTTAAENTRPVTSRTKSAPTPNRS